jgi:hypothetical protein
MSKQLAVTEDELRQILGARETKRIAKQVEALRAPDVTDDQLAALREWIDGGHLGQRQARIVPALFAFFHANPRQALSVRRWLNELGVK